MLFELCSHSNVLGMHKSWFFCGYTTSAFSPSETMASSSQYISVTPTSSAAQLTTRIVFPSTPTIITPSGKTFPSANVLPSTSTPNGRLCSHNHGLFRLNSVYKGLCKYTPILALTNGILFDLKLQHSANQTQFPMLLCLLDKGFRLLIPQDFCNLWELKSDEISKVVRLQSNTILDAVVATFGMCGFIGYDCFAHSGWAEPPPVHQQRNCWQLEVIKIYCCSMKALCLSVTWEWQSSNITLARCTVFWKK